MFRTFTPVDTKEAIYEKIDYIASLLERDLESEGWAGKVVILSYKLDTFKSEPFCHQLWVSGLISFSTHSPSDIRAVNFKKGRFD